MNPVAELVGQDHHVARLALVVEQQVGVRAGHRGMGEGPRRLAGADRGVDPVVLEEAPADVRELGREGAVGREYGLDCLVPADEPVVVFRQRRGAVPIVEAVRAHPARLERIVAMGETRRRGLHGRDQRVHHLVLHPVAEIAGGDRPLESAPLVLDLLVLGQRVGDEREGAHVLAEHGAQRLRRLLAHLAVLVREQVERVCAGERLAAHGEAKRRHGLVEEAHPGRAARDLLLVQEALHLVRELERAERALIAHPGCIAGERGGLQLLPECCVPDPVELQREEEQPAAGGGGLFAHGLEEARRLGVVHRRAIDQVGVARQPLQGLLDCLVAGDQAAQRRAVESGDPPRELLVQRLSRRSRPIQVALELVRIRGRVEVGKVPSRQRRVVLRRRRGVRPSRCSLRHRHQRLWSKVGLRRSRKAASPSR